jgi:hypothetical protein
MKWLAHTLALIVLTLIVLQVAFGIATGVEFLDGLPFVFVLIAALAVGWLLAVRLPRNPLGWLLIAIPTLFTIGGATSALAELLYPVAPLVSTWLYVLFGSEGVDNWSWVPPVWLLLCQLPLRFPTGRLPSPRWRAFQWFSIGALIVCSTTILLDTPEATPGIPNPVHLEGVGGQPAVVLLAFGSLGVAFIGSIASLFIRYRGANVIERAQIRWVLWAVAVAVGSLIGTWLFLVFVPGVNVSGVFLTTYSLIPIAIGVSVMRYRLYEIDRIISRTASYAIVSVVVIGVYLLVVSSVQLILPGLPAIGVALATLAAAALFLPVLRWVRRHIDRRFDRERYNAEKVVDAFGEHLRTDLDPHSTSGELLDAVERTLQPTSVGIWTMGRSSS